MVPYKHDGENRRNSQICGFLMDSSFDTKRALKVQYMSNTLQFCYLGKMELWIWTSWTWIKLDPKFIWVYLNLDPITNKSRSCTPK